MRQPSALQALARVAGSSGESIVLFSSNPDLDLAEILAFAELMSRLRLPRHSVVVATPHPTAAWLAPLVEEGLDGLRITDSIGCGESDEGPGRTRHAGEAAARMCPRLHACLIGDRTLSVCGAHRDRMVLALHHLDSWCLENHARCPHWLPPDEEARDERP